MAKVRKMELRGARKERIRKRVSGSTERPRLSVFKSSRFIYAQVIDDLSGKTVCSASSLEKDFRTKNKSTRNLDAAKQVGKLLAERAKQNKIAGVVFDRNGYGYHGRVKALADSARESGLNF